MPGTPKDFERESEAPRDAARVEIRQAGSEDWAALASLRFAWRAGESGEVGLDESTFSAAFEGWWRAHQGGHLAFVASSGRTPVGMAFLAVVERVPGPGRWLRRAGNLQSVYVRPEWRRYGVGSALCEATVSAAAGLGLDYLSVHPSEMSFTFYRRLGFEPSGRVLELDLRT